MTYEKMNELQKVIEPLKRVWAENGMDVELTMYESNRTDLCTIDIAFYADPIYLGSIVLELLKIARSNDCISEINAYDDSLEIEIR